MVPKGHALQTHQFLALGVLANDIQNVVRVQLATAGLQGSAYGGYFGVSLGLFHFKAAVGRLVGRKGIANGVGVATLGTSHFFAGVKGKSLLRLGCVVLRSNGLNLAQVGEAVAAATGLEKRGVVS